MASSFKNITASGTSAGSTLMTVPASTTTVVIGLTIANISGVLLTVDLKVGTIALLDNVPIPAGSTLGALDGKLVLETGDTLVEACSTDAGVDYIISYMEIT